MKLQKLANVCSQCSVVLLGAVFATSAVAMPSPRRRIPPTPNCASGCAPMI